MSQSTIREALNQALHIIQEPREIIDQPISADTEWYCGTTLIDWAKESLPKTNWDWEQLFLNNAFADKVDAHTTVDQIQSFPAYLLPIAKAYITAAYLTAIADGHLNGTESGRQALSVMRELINQLEQKISGRSAGPSLLIGSNIKVSGVNNSINGFYHPTQHKILIETRLVNKYLTAIKRSPKSLPLGLLRVLIHEASHSLQGKGIVSGTISSVKTEIDAYLTDAVFGYYLLVAVVGKKAAWEYLKENDDEGYKIVFHLLQGNEQVARVEALMRDPRSAALISANKSVRDIRELEKLEWPREPRPTIPASQGVIGELPVVTPPRVPPAGPPPAPPPSAPPLIVQPRPTPPPPTVPGRPDLIPPPNSPPPGPSPTPFPRVVTPPPAPTTPPPGAIPPPAPGGSPPPGAPADYRPTFERSSGGGTPPPDGKSTEGSPPPASPPPSAPPSGEELLDSYEPKVARGETYSRDNEYGPLGRDRDKPAKEEKPKEEPPKEEKPQGQPEGGQPEGYQNPDAPTEEQKLQRAWLNSFMNYAQKGLTQPQAGTTSKAGGGNIILTNPDAPTNEDLTSGGVARKLGGTVIDPANPDAGYGGPTRSPNAPPSDSRVNPQNAGTPIEQGLGHVYDVSDVRQAKGEDFSRCSQNPGLAGCPQDSTTTAPPPQPGSDKPTTVAAVIPGITKDSISADRPSLLNRGTSSSLVQETSRCANDYQELKIAGGNVPAICKPFSDQSLNVQCDLRSGDCSGFICRFEGKDCQLGLVGRAVSTSDYECKVSAPGEWCATGTSVACSQEERQRAYDSLRSKVDVSGPSQLEGQFLCSEKSGATICPVGYRLERCWTTSADNFGYVCGVNQTPNICAASGYRALESDGADICCGYSSGTSQPAVTSTSPKGGSTTSITPQAGSPVRVAGDSGFDSVEATLCARGAKTGPECAKYATTTVASTAPGVSKGGTSPFSPSFFKGIATKPVPEGPKCAPDHESLNIAAGNIPSFCHPSTDYGAHCQTVIENGKGKDVCSGYICRFKGGTCQLGLTSTPRSTSTYECKGPSSVESAFVDLQSKVTITGPSQLEGQFVCMEKPDSKLCQAGYHLEGCWTNSPDNFGYICQDDQVASACVAPNARLVGSAVIDSCCAY